MRVNYEEFKLACKRLAQAGLKEAAPPCGITAMYCAFDMDCGGWFSLKDFDEDSFALLAKFAVWAKQKLGRPSLCVKNWETKSGEGINLGAFQRHTKPLGMTTEERDMLFEGLSLEGIVFEQPGKKGSISQAELIFLDAWKPDEDAREPVSFNQLASP